MAVWRRQRVSWRGTRTRGIGDRFEHLGCGAGGHVHGQVASAQDVRAGPGPHRVPCRSVTAATMGSPQPWPRAVGAAAGPGSVTSTRAHRGAVRTVTVNVPASPAADQ